MTAAVDGVWAAALTPMKDDLSVDMAALVAHQHWLLANGCDGLGVLGTTGEANSLSVAERRRIIEATAEAGHPAERIIVGTGCCALPDTLELTGAALAAGYPSVLVLPPFYYKGVSEDGLFAAYAELAQRVGDARLRIYVYDFPAMTGLEMPPALIERLHRAYPETIVGMKDSSGRWDDMAEVMRRIPGFRLYAGTEEFLLAALRAGGAGCISATVNVTSRLAGELYAAHESDRADALQARLTEVRKMVSGHGGIPALKQLVADQRGAGWLNIRPPLVRLSAEKARALREDFGGHGMTLADAA